MMILLSATLGSRKHWSCYLGGGDGMANLFLNNVIRLNGLPEDVTSDWGPQFISHFWSRLLQTFGTSVNLSTRYHPQTDGQTKQVNQILEQYLWFTTNYQQDDWVNFIAMAEFAYNNSIHASTKVSPFFANYGFHPRFSISIPETSINPSAKRRAYTLQDVHRDLSFELCVVAKKYKSHADGHRLCRIRVYNGRIHTVPLDNPSLGYFCK